MAARCSTGRIDRAPAPVVDLRATPTGVPTDATERGKARAGARDPQVSVPVSPSDSGGGPLTGGSAALATIAVHPGLDRALREGLYIAPRYIVNR